MTIHTQNFTTRFIEKYKQKIHRAEMDGINGKRRKTSNTLKCIRNWNLIRNVDEQQKYKKKKNN